MADAEKGVYRRRHPERTDYYRIIEANFEEFLRSYPEQFEEKYGYIRPEVKKAVYAFLDCGITENGMARVRCDECGHDFFAAFSCRCRVVCPSPYESLVYYYGIYSSSHSFGKLRTSCGKERRENKGQGIIRRLYSSCGCLSSGCRVC